MEVGGSAIMEIESSEIMVNLPVPIREKLTPITEIAQEVHEEITLVEEDNNNLDMTEYNETECAICLEEMTIGNISQLDCKQKGAPDNHWFHQACIKEWLNNYGHINGFNKRITQKCPICRTGTKILITIDDESGNQPISELTYTGSIFKNDILRQYGCPENEEEDVAVRFTEELIRSEQLGALRSAYVDEDTYRRRQRLQALEHLGQQQESERARHRRRRQEGGCSIL